jgi:hypothetical protein
MVVVHDGVPPNRPNHAGAGDGHNTAAPVEQSRFPPTSVSLSLNPALLASILREIVRDADIVTYAALLGRCVVLMPEVCKAEARQALARVGHLCANRIGLAIRAGIAVFPEEGWTLEDLIQHAEQMDEEAKRPPETLADVTSREGATA